MTLVVKQFGMKIFQEAKFSPRTSIVNEAMIARPVLLFILKLVPHSVEREDKEGIPFLLLFCAHSKAKTLARISFQPFHVSVNTFLNGFALLIETRS